MRAFRSDADGGAIGRLPVRWSQTSARVLAPRTVEVLNDPGFGQVVRREEQFGAPCGTGGEGHGEGPPDGAEVALQAHLAQDHGMLEVSLGKLAAGQQQARGRSADPARNHPCVCPREPD